MTTLSPNNEAADDIEVQETSDEHKFKCKFCQKNYSKRCILRRHIKRVHERMRNLQCQQCDKKYFDNSQLKIHSERVHEKSNVKRNFECAECGKLFRDKPTLMKHINVQGVQDQNLPKVMAIALK